MEVHIFVLCCAFFATVAAFTLPDQVTEYSRKDDLMKIVESEGCKCKNGRCVTDNRGKSKCNCPPGYSLQDESTCEPCDCGEKGRCMFIAHEKSVGEVLYEKKCLCDQGSAEKDGLCIDCHCGDNSKCEFEGDEKICYCIDKYSEKDGVCTECDCGFFGECKFENGQKKCSCDDGYLVHDGTCKACKCGEYGVCSLNDDGKKVCSCLEGFSDNKGTCEKCDCGPDSVTCGFTNGQKNCTCKANKAQREDVCIDCKCGYNSDGCIFYGEKKECLCLEGYVQKDDGTCRVRCSDSNPCQNDGRCDGGICSCLQGTSGEFCEIIDDCDNLCPKIPGVECAFNPGKLARYCKCTDENMGFNNELQSCKPTCDDTSSVCQNGGKCADKNQIDNSRFCRCLEGTEGDFCEKIPGCLSEDCGSYAECTYDVDKRSAVCKCDDATLSFDPVDRTCKRTCDDDTSCKNGGLCTEVGSSRFCRCLDGTDGDFCEKVVVCDTKDCGHEARCIFDVETKSPSCLCSDENLSFDPIDKTCKKACQDSDCQNGGKCTGGESSRFCDCLDGTKGDFCEEVVECDAKDCGVDAKCAYDVERQKATCLCADETLSFDPLDNRCKRNCEDERQCQNGGKCSLRDNTHFCDCLPGTSGDLCEIVDECEKNVVACADESKCSFDVAREKAFCECPDEEKQKYDPLDKKCKNTCNEDAECKNGGLCMHRGDNLFCQCKVGTSGVFCEVVDDCERGVCGDRSNTTCGYDVTSETVVCGCRNPSLLYDPDTKQCKACDCGRNAVSCSFEKGEKVCTCKDGFVDEDGTCKKKWCTEKKCLQGKCEVVGEEEVCKCYEGYVLEGDYCKQLNCSKTPCVNGTCIVGERNIEKCICPSGYTLRFGECIRGMCRFDTCFGGRCQKIDGELMCVCPERFNLEGIGCFETVCKIQHCFGGKCVVKNDEEICTCPENHVLVGNVCKRILCEKKSCFGGYCSIVDGEEVCTCPQGYVLVEDVCRRA